MTRDQLDTLGSTIDANRNQFTSENILTINTLADIARQLTRIADEMDHQSLCRDIRKE